MLRKTSPWDKWLAGLLSFHLFWNSIWIYLNNAPFPWDQAAHSTIVLRIADALRNGHFLSIFGASNYYPIFIHTLASIPILLFGPLPKLTQITATLIFLLTLVFIYRYIFLITGNKKTSFVTTAIFSFFPVVFNASRWLMLDIPTVGVLFLALYFLEKSENWTRRGYTTYFFISSGLLMMTKWTGMLFLVVPAIFTFILILEKKEFGKIWINLAIGIVLFLVVILPWYLVNFQSLLFQSRINIIGEAGAKPSNVLSFQSLSLYFYQLFNFQANFWVAMSFFISLPFFIFQKNPRKWFILLMIIGNYIIFSLISNKDSRYTMAYLPFVALVITSVLEKIGTRFKLLANGLTFCLILMSVVYYLLLTIRPLSLEGTYISIDWHRFGRTDVVDLNDRLAKKYDESDWSVSSVLDDMESLSNGKDIGVQVAIEDEHLSPATLQLYLYARQYRGLMSNIYLNTPDIYFLRSSFQSDTFPNDAAIAKYLQYDDYILMSPIDVGTEFLRNKEALIQLREFVLHDTRVACNAFQASPAPKKTTCYVKDSEILQTVSDIQINDQGPITDENQITGPAKIYCEWGCSFKVIKPPDLNIHPYAQIEKTYLLPDGKTVYLYSLH